jgi:Uncharacterized protein conserved in bacteria (DUF2330)
MPIEAMITREQALLIVDGERQQLIASVQLSEAAPGAAVVLPVPGTPEVDQPAGGDELFAYLAEATRPEVRREERLVWGDPSDGMTGGAAPGAVLLGRETLGGYDVARLAADDGAALQQWLDENGYTMPAAAAPILAAYAADGWSFVAVKLADAAPEGSLAPLRISYRAAQPVYPMRLGALSPQPVAVDLYLLAAGRMQVPALETAFAGPAAQLDPPPAPAVAALLSGAPYLTRLRAAALDPASLDADFVADRAPSDEPYREVITLYDDVNILRRTGLLVGLACATSLSGLAIAIAIGFRRRLDSFNPDKR